MLLIVYLGGRYRHDNIFLLACGFMNISKIYILSLVFATQERYARKNKILLEFQSVQSTHLDMLN